MFNSEYKCSTVKLLQAINSYPREDLKLHWMIRGNLLKALKLDFMLFEICRQGVPEIFKKQLIHSSLEPACPVLQSKILPYGSRMTWTLTDNYSLISQCVNLISKTGH